MKHKLLLLPPLLAAVCFLLLRTGTGPAPAQAPDPPPAAQTLEGPPAPPAPDWRLTLVNAQNPLPEDFSVALTQLKNGHAVDERCYPDLQAMMDDCRAAGLSPLICSSFRTRERQQALFDNKADKLTAQGLSPEEARLEAAKVVAAPGTSEHQLGLAVDIVDTTYQLLDDQQADTAVQQWLLEHCWDYGFILRYPAGKTAVTGVNWEPWHYRYVGKEAAAAIREQGLCLEEYLSAETEA